MNARRLIAFLLGKVLRIVTLLVALCLLCFWLISQSPIDPVQAYVGADMMRVSPEQREQIAAYWGLNRPPLEQAGCWVSALLHGDLGFHDLSPPGNRGA